jgi:MarR family transcriptional regulator, organic hydroperoxide resistance regulator
MPKANSTFDFDKPEDSPGFLLWKTTIIWQRLIKKALIFSEISHPQFVILAITLWFENQAQEVTQSLIIHQSKLDKMTVSQSLKKLVSDGYIQRYEHPGDTRMKTICLTKKGKTLVSKLVPIIEKVDAEFFNMISRHDQKVLLLLLKNLVAKTKTPD